MSIKKIPLYIITCCIAFTLFGFVKADEDPISKAVAGLTKWLDNYPQEKVYLQFDKPYYAVGDDIWFKAYITTGPRHELSALSGALNVELIDGRDSVKQAIKLPVENGIVNGDFALSDTLAEGNYRIRAYTNWMRNAGPDYFFDKTIWIGGAAKNTVVLKTDYSYITANNQTSVNALINFSSLAGAPYTGKEVSYQVQLNGKNALRGKGVTDDKGNLKVTFTGTTAGAFKSGEIIANIKIDPKTTVTKTIPVTAVSNQVDVQFFPEGGYLVEGLPSKIAFKAVGADGLGKAISGKVMDNDGAEIADINTQHLGMGSFMLVPQAGKTYSARVSFADGSQRTIDLQKPRQEGFVLTINDTDPQNINLRIMASSSVPDSGRISLIAQSGGAVCYAAKNKIQNGVVASKIAKSKFPSGIAQFTLFDGAGNPVCERLVFINNPDQLKLEVTTAKPQYAPREKVSLQLSTNDPEDKPMISALSASVIDETRVPVDEDSETSILSQLLLSSDLKGYIEKPNYYFLHHDAKTQADLDVLMLTQGYRRFEWKQILSGETPPVIYQPERTLQISGRVHTHNGKPVARGKVTLFTSMGGPFIIDTLTDEQGRFAFKDLIFKDSVKFVIQARTDKNKKDVEIDLDNVARQIVTANRNAADVEINVSSRILPYLQSSKEYYNQQLRAGVGNHNILLKEVVITEKKKKLENSSNLNGAGNADQVIGHEVFDNMGCPDIATCLQGRLLGVIFRNGVPYSTRGGGPMQIILDGIYVDSDMFRDINPYDIASIEVLRSGTYTAIYGSRGGSGVIVINTKRGNGDYSAVHVYTPGVITYSPKGYYNARVFYSPQYDDPKVNTALADARTTIYWKPNIVTGKDGRSTIEYFNAGSKGTYRVVVEGIDTEGHIGHKVFRYEVQ